MGAAGFSPFFTRVNSPPSRVTFSPELADLTLYVISVCQGEEIPRKGGPGITRSDLLIINKTDLAPHVGADLDVMRPGQGPEGVVVERNDGARSRSLCLLRT